MPYPVRAAVALALLGVLAVALPVPPARASCTAGTPAQRAAAATAVFRGGVTAIEPAPEPPGTVYFGPRRVTFAVDTVWKGAVPATVVVTENDRGTTAAEFRWQRGDVYLVYARGTAGALTTDACSGAALAGARAADPGTLGVDTAPEPVPLPASASTGDCVGRPSTPALAAGLVLAAALVGTALYAARRVRRSGRPA